MRTIRTTGRIRRLALGVTAATAFTLVPTAPAATASDAPAAPAPSRSPAAAPAPARRVPSSFRVRTYVSGLNHPWDLAFTPRGWMFATERSGWIGLRLKPSGRYVRILRPTDVFVNGEGGMLGIALSPRFAQTKEVFVCFNTANDVRVVRYKFADHPRRLIQRHAIVTGIEANPSGRHSGCRLRFGPDGFLWITTGDAARGTNPQNLHVLNGKVLRVTRTGAPAPGNFRGRLFAYGFRNPQGITFRPSDGRAFIVEHGPGRDDEITPLFRGGNGGWNPVGGGLFYNEGVPMTDLSLPNVIRPVWQSGFPTIAPSGGTFVTNRDWGAWRGRMVIAVLKAEHLRLIDVRRGVADQGRIILRGFGRLRNAVEGPFGNLYVPVDADPGRILVVNPIP
jgi:glucose/arabinose dehydrogenase